MADGGTLFLDEIANSSVGFQEKILRVIEYQQFERVRGTETVHVDVRVVAATNADLERLMETHAFREDLYDRLSFQTIHTPPLREHLGDVPELVRHFLTRFKAEVPSVTAVQASDHALRKLMEYPWPGNVRELKNVIERAATLSREEVVDAEHLELKSPGERHAPTGFAEQICTVECSLILDALRRTDFSQTNAARLLGMSYDQFRHYFRKYREQLKA
jgi:DNA-binding NtrC family response regulator